MNLAAWAEPQVLDSRFKGLQINSFARLNVSGISH